MTEPSKAEKLARSLDAWVSQKLLPGLFPGTATEAAELLREQDRELAALRKAVAAKDHIVEATAEREHYRQKFRATFIIADPRLYYAEMAIDDRLASVGPADWRMHVARQLVRVGTAEWIRELEEKALAAIMRALTPDRSGEAGETRSGSAVGESGLPEGSSK